MIIWTIIFFMSILSLFVMVHEATHAIRIDSPQAICMGLGDNAGKVYHENFYTQSQINKEEIIANTVASIVVLLYMITTYYMIMHFRP